MVDEPLAASVVVCTHRPQSPIARCLASIRGQALPRECFEIIVVDNAPSARPPLAEFADVHWLHEARGGLSLARNSGVAAARGAVIAFIDDDATADRDWLANLLAAFETDQTIACVGGPIELALPTERPRWHDAALDGWWSRFDPPPETLTVVTNFSQLPYGANLAVRRSVLNELNGFSADWGRGRENLSGGEDLEFCLRVMRAGHRVCTTSRAKVLHHIDAGRMTLEYLWRVSREAGISLAGLQTHDSPFGYLGKSIMQWAKATYPLKRMSRGRRLNHLLQGRMYLTAAISPGPGSRPQH
jgi:GT2 family glycosyltransferase